ncbi:MAG: aminoglycoside phosphotransferase family protein [Candidatus Krumholzibacteriia bacterium]
MTLAPRVADPRFDAVRTGMDTERVKALLNARLREAGGSVCIRNLSLEYSFYVPGSNFRAVYQAELVNGTANETQRLFGRITYAGDSAVRFAKARRKLAKGRFLKPRLGEGAYHLPEIDMVLWTFPNDPRLKTLVGHADPGTVRRALANLEDARGWEPGGMRQELVRYIPGKRGVLRYEVEWRRPRRPDGSPQALPASRLECIFGKVYDTPLAALRAREALEDLWAASQRQTRFLRVPKPLHYEPGLRTLWLSQVPGAHLAAEAWKVDTACMARIGRGLALLHQARVRVRPTLGLEQELESMRENATLIAKVHQDLRPGLERVHAALAKSLPRLPRLPLVPAHGTFKLNHLLSDGEQISLIDFDSMVLADPTFDVANFTADLHYLEARGTLPPGRASKLGRALQEVYFGQVPWGRCDPVLNWYVASLLVRKQAFKCVKHLHPDADRKIRKVLDEALRRTRRLET